MKRYQLNLISVAIILVVISLAFIIYYQYSMNVKKQQENLIFENFINNLQNLEDTINSIQGTYYVKVNIPNGVILYANGKELIIQYNNNNYTIIFYKNVKLYNNNQSVSFLYPNNYIYLVSTNNTVFITTNLQNSIKILNEYLPNGTLIYVSPGNNQSNMNAQCLFQYTGQPNFFWGDVNGNNYLPPIGNQGGCGDCEAFASANGIASIYMIRNNQPNKGLQLSPAYLAIKCNKGYPNTPSYCNYTIGCKGSTVNPYYYILFASKYGIPPDPGWSYYDSTLGNCSEKIYQNYSSYPGDVCFYNYNGPSSPLYYPQGVIDLTQNGYLTNQQIIQDLLCYGPLVAAGFLAGINGSNPNIYPQRIVPDTGHSMILVGYTTGNTTYSQLCQYVYGTPDCWIFENQWGNYTFCIIFNSTGSTFIDNSSNNLFDCQVFYSNYQACSNAIKSPCAGVYWMQDGYLLVPFSQSPFGLTFPNLIAAIQNVTLS